MKDKNTSPIGVLLITIVTIIITLLLVTKCNKPNIITAGQTVSTKTNTKTIVKTHTDTLFVTRNNTLYVNKYITLKDTIKDDRKQITQTFNIKDSILDLTIFTIANDTVNELTIDYKFDQPTITITDSILVNTTITLENKEDKIKLDKLKAKQFPRFISSFLGGIISGIILNKYILEQ